MNLIKITYHIPQFPILMPATDGWTKGDMQGKQTVKIFLQHGLIENMAKSRIHSHKIYLLHCFCIPPVLVELSITKAEKLSKYVQPIFATLYVS